MVTQQEQRIRSNLFSTPDVTVRHRLSRWLYDVIVFSVFVVFVSWLQMLMGD